MSDLNVRLFPNICKRARRELGNIQAVVRSSRLSPLKFLRRPKSGQASRRKPTMTLSPEERRKRDVAAAFGPETLLLAKEPSNNDTQKVERREEDVQLE
jgi:hypothetical protein